MKVTKTQKREIVNVLWTEANEHRRVASLHFDGEQRAKHIEMAGFSERCASDILLTIDVEG